MSKNSGAIGAFLKDSQSIQIQESLLIPKYQEISIGVEHDKTSLYFTRFVFDNLFIIILSTIIIKIVAGYIIIYNLLRIFTF